MHFESSAFEKFLKYLSELNHPFGQLFYTKKKLTRISIRKNVSFLIVVIGTCKDNLTKENNIFFVSLNTKSVNT